MRIRYEPSTDSFATRITSVLGLIAALCIPLTAVRAFLDIAEIWRWYPCRFDRAIDGVLDSADFFSAYGQVLLTTGIPFVAAILASSLLPLLMRRRWSPFVCERRVASSRDVADRMAARLLEIGYELADATASKIVLRPRPRNMFVSVLLCDISRYRHEVELEEGVARVKFGRGLIDTGEIEYAERLLTFLETDAPEFHVRRTLYGLSTVPVWLAAVASIAAWVPAAAPAVPWLVAVAIAFGALALGVVHLLRRRVYGRRFALIGIWLGICNALWLL